MSIIYREWHILTFPTPIGGHMAACYAPGVEPSAQAEKWVTPWWNTENQAVASAKGKIDFFESLPGIEQEVAAE